MASKKTEQDEDEKKVLASSSSSSSMAAADDKKGNAAEFCSICMDSPSKSLGLLACVSFLFHSV